MAGKRVRECATALVLLLTALVAGCGQEEQRPPTPPSTGQQPQPVPTTTEPDPAPPPTTPPSGAGCPESYPVHLPLEPETADEVPALEGLVACTDTAEQTVQLRNDSLVIWVVDRPSGLRWRRANPDLPPQVRHFRDMVAAQGLVGLAVEPGQKALIETTPARLHLRLDSAAMSLWHQVVLFKELIDGWRQDAFAKIIAGRSPGRNVLVQCAQAAWEGGQKLPQVGQQQRQDLVSLQLTVWGLGGQLSSCGQAMRAAQAEGTALPKVEEVRTRIRTSGWRAVTNKVVSWALAGARAIPKVPG